MTTYVVMIGSQNLQKVKMVAKDIDNMRRILMNKYTKGLFVICTAPKNEDSTRVIGQLVIKPKGTYWVPSDSDVRRPVLKNGKLQKMDFKKYTADGFPIYKIWKYWNSDDGHVVLARHPKSNEWIFGRNYNIKTGRWVGGTYRMRLEDLYERCPPYGVLIVNNKRGPTGKY